MVDEYRRLDKAIQKGQFSLGGVGAGATVLAFVVPGGQILGIFGLGSFISTTIIEHYNEYDDMAEKLEDYARENLKGCGDDDEV